MIGRQVLRHQGSSRLGFTAVEVMLMLTMVAILTAMVTPRIGLMLERMRLNRTTAVVAADLESAFSLAARQRQPIRISCACGSTRYTLADRNGGTVRVFRSFSGDRDYGVQSLTFAPAQVDVFPSGVASDTLRVTIASGSVSRVIRMTSAGQVRILP
jgi:type II secretory pathway pseudopilin PulG